jgi:hypothetical protein
MKLFLSGDALGGGYWHPSALRSLLPLAIVTLQLGCAPDSSTSLVSSHGPPARLYSAEYYCLQGDPGYEDYCDNFGGSAAADTGWQDKVHWLDAVRSRSDSLEMAYINKGFSQADASLFALRDYDPNGCTPYYEEIQAMQQSATVGIYDARDMSVDANGDTFSAITDWGTGEWAFSIQDLELDMDDYPSAYQGVGLADDMLHEVIHGVDGVGNSQSDEAYVTERTQECSNSTIWPMHLRSRQLVRTGGIS